MSELIIPEHWVEATLGDIGTSMIGLTYSPNDISDQGIPVLRSGNIQKGKIELDDLVRVKREIRPQLMIKEGDILICARNGSRALVGKAAQIKSLSEPMTFGAFMAIFRSELNNYIELFLNSLIFRKQLDGVGTATINQITQNNLKQFIIPLPPVEEQNRILSKARLCFEKIEATEANLKKVETLLEKYRESLLAKAFRGELVPQDPGDEPASVLLEKIRKERSQNAKGKKTDQEFSPILDDEKPFELPAGWEWVRFTELIKKLKRGPSKSANKEGKGIRYLTTGNVKKGRLDLISEVKYLAHDYNPEACLLTENDLILTCVNSKVKLGETAVFKNSSEPCIVGFNNYGITLYPSVDVEYINICCTSNMFISQVRRLSKDAINQSSISTKDLEEILIPLAPEKLQTRISSKFDSCSSHLNVISGKINSLNKITVHLKNSILQKAFEGRLVEQITSEGTGHELLAKILAEKDSTQESQPKTSTKNTIMKAPAKKVVATKGKKNGKK